MTVTNIDNAKPYACRDEMNESIGEGKARRLPVGNPPHEWRWQENVVSQNDVLKNPHIFLVS